MSPKAEFARLPSNADIDADAIHEGDLAPKTQVKYAQFITGAGGWNEFWEARDVGTDMVNADTALNIARNIFRLSNSLTLGQSLVWQTPSALCAHFYSSRGSARWVVGTTSDPDIPATTFVNPAVSSEVADMMMDCKTMMAMQGEMQVKRVDPIEPCYPLWCWGRELEGREVDAIGERILVAYAAMLLSIKLLLRHDELTMLQYAIDVSAYLCAVIYEHEGVLDACLRQSKGDVDGAEFVSVVVTFFACDSGQFLLLPCDRFCDKIEHMGESIA